MNAQYQPGLESAIASETTISYLDVEKEEIVLRGYDLIELAKQMTYLDIVGLIMNGTLPDVDQRALLEEKLKSEYPFPQDVLAMLKLFPKQANLMDVLRTGISAIASYDDELEDRSWDANNRKTIRLLAKVPQIVQTGTGP